MICSDWIDSCAKLFELACCVFLSVEAKMASLAATKLHRKSKLPECAARKKIQLQQKAVDQLRQVLTCEERLRHRQKPLAW
jgi:hypothetical protein